MKVLWGRWLASPGWVEAGPRPGAGRCMQRDATSGVRGLASVDPEQGTSPLWASSSPAVKERGDSMTAPQILRVWCRVLMCGVARHLRVYRVP